jgi:2-hydroxychromene-2-carboxylate isomerase
MKRRAARVYFSFRSPYSWMGVRLLEERFPTAPQQIEYIPFWDPDAHMLALLHALGGEYLYTPMSKAKHLYILLDIKRSAAQFGYCLTWPVDVNAWWDLPHLAYLVARRVGKGQEFFWAAHRARWERGENIFTVEAIRRLADEVGANAEELARAPENEEIRAEGALALYRAYQDDVFGVPYFKVGNERFWGIDRFEEFAASFATNAEIDVPPVVTLNVDAFSEDHTGGCG